MGVLGELNNTTPVSKGKSKSKTPLKSPAPAPVGLLTPNNDKREKERNKLARQASEVSRRCVRCRDGIYRPSPTRVESYPRPRERNERVVSNPHIARAKP